MRSKGTAVELEVRRRLAVQRVADGWAQKDVAAFLGVHPVTVARWVARHRAGSDDGLKAKPTPGRPRFLTDDQEKQVLGWLAEPPTKHGFDTDLWTDRRVFPCKLNNWETKVVDSEVAKAEIVGWLRNPSASRGHSVCPTNTTENGSRSTPTS